MLSNEISCERSRDRASHWDFVFNAINDKGTDECSSYDLSLQENKYCEHVFWNNISIYFHKLSFLRTDPKLPG